jgi:hypothetical protein
MLASNQVRQLLQTDHIWNFTIVVLPFIDAIFPHTPSFSGCSHRSGNDCLLCAKSSYFVIATK